MNTLEELARKALRSDGIIDAEAMTGKSYKEDSTTLALGMVNHIVLNERKRALLSELGDTYFHIPWADFVHLLRDYGFEFVVERQFDYRDVHPTFLIAAHPQKKLLLCATSFLWGTGGKETINSGTVYGMTRVPDEGEWDVLSGCSHGRSGGNRDFSYDVREGLFLKLRDIEFALGPFLDWEDSDRFLWMRDYVQEKDEDWRGDRDAFLQAAPSWVRGFVVGLTRETQK